MTLKYPQDLTEMNTDYVTFTHSEYRSNTETGAQPPRQSDSPPIILYVPNSTPAIGVDNDWGEVRFEGQLGALIRDAAITGANVAQSFDPAAVLGSAEGARGEAKKVVDEFKKNFQDIGKRGGDAVRQGAVQAIAGFAQTSPSQLLALSRGQSYNPNVELLYKSPKLRGFSMSYTFVAKSEAENRAVNQIIREFKKWSSPEDEGNGMFAIPHLWQVTYKTGGSDNIQMNKFKPAALANVSVVDNPTSSMHVSHTGGAPVERIMTLTFSEVELILRNDYDNDEGVGF